MESAPPSYQEATQSEIWLLVAPYLTSEQLCQASLVSRKWHSIFAAQLWSRPASHDVLDHFLRYQSVLESARLSVRSFTFCLHLLPDEAHYFNERPADWLKRLLELLPNLQALVVTGISFFDHATCQALYQDKTDSSLSNKGRSPSGSLFDESAFHISHSIGTNVSFHALRLLDASRCNNLTSTSLAGALRQFSSLLYLDLSYTSAARNPTVLSSFRHLYGLKILKLRSIQLKDDGISYLSPAIGRRLCCLDIRDNELTSAAITILQSSCFLDTMVETDAASTTLLESEHMDTRIYAAYTDAAVNHLIIEDVPEQGLTQLYISGNQLDDRTVTSLVHLPSLRILDVGSLSNPFVAPFLSSRLAYLRIEHTMIVPDDKQKVVRLRPRSLPHLHTLVLINVPNRSSDDHIAAALITFVRDCAIEAFDAMTEAKGDYTAPPGHQGRVSALQRSARKIFGLLTIILEMSSSAAVVLTGPQSRTTSLTGDKDSGAMWSAGESDFSFFRDDEKTSSTQEHASEAVSTKHSIDNLALLSAFRADRKAAYEHAMLTGQSTFVEGYWPGTIRVQRLPPANR